MDFLLAAVLRVLTAAINTLPAPLRLAFLTGCVRATFFLMPKFKRNSLRNLKLAFPEKDDAWRRDVLARSYSSLGRAAMDFLRLPKLDEAWVREHIEFPRYERFKELTQVVNGPGAVIPTGHLGSFELMAHSAARMGAPLSFVVRNSKMPRVDAWWRSLRECNGNRAIARKGAFPEIVKEIYAGHGVGILFDQNVTRNHAVFVDWFGVPAATTKTIALAALRAGAPVMITSFPYLGDERYRLDMEEFDFSAIREDKARSSEEKVREITATLAAYYEKLIRARPHEWFWMHNRWKTRPDEQS